MTRIVIFILCGRVQLMIHFVVNTSPSKLCAFAPFAGDIPSSAASLRQRHAGLFLLSRVFD